MHQDTIWKCPNCDLTFEQEQLALAHNAVFKHEVKKIDSLIFN